MLRKLESEDARSSTEGRREIRRCREGSSVPRGLREDASGAAHRRQADKGSGQREVEAYAPAPREQRMPSAVVTRLGRAAGGHFTRLVSSVARTRRRCRRLRDRLHDRTGRDAMQFAEAHESGQGRNKRCQKRRGPEPQTHPVRTIYRTE